IVFAEKLVARYPARDMYPAGDPDAEDAIWEGNPLASARRLKEAVFGLSLPRIDRPRVMRFLVEAANAVGLIVFDEQAGIAYLPNGKVLPNEAADMRKDLSGELDSMPVAWSKARARKALATSLAATLAKHGFRFVPVKERPKTHATCAASFTRDVEEGSQ